METLGYRPPTSKLHSIQNLGTCAIQDLDDSIQYLRTIYNPEVRGSRRKRKPSESPRATHQFGDDKEDFGLESLRMDSFERAYAVKWLIALISRLESEDLDGEQSAISEESLSLTKVLQKATSLLAVLAGTASAGVLTRDFVFTASHGPENSSFTVTLRDVPLENQNYGSVGAQTWGGACVMAEMIVEDPMQFSLNGISNRGSFPAAEKVLRILELGAGTGLVSLTIAKLLQNIIVDTSTRATIIATDYYPSVLKNLQENIYANHPKELKEDGIVSISAHPLDWSAFPCQNTEGTALSEPFDVVFGADIVYEAEHAFWIKSCLSRLLRRPCTTHFVAEPSFHLIIPLRATHAFESNTIDKVFAISSGEIQSQLGIKSKEIFICDAQSGDERDEVEYAYYKIGWCLS